MTSPDKPTKEDALTRIDRLIEELARAIKDVNTSYQDEGIDVDHYARTSSTLMRVSKDFYLGYP